MTPRSPPPPKEKRAVSMPGIRIGVTILMLEAPAHRELRTLPPVEFSNEEDREPEIDMDILQPGRLYVSNGREFGSKPNPKNLDPDEEQEDFEFDPQGDILDKVVTAKKELERQRHDLSIRESLLAERLLQFEQNYCDITTLPLIPSMKELQQLGINAHEIVIWIETVKFIAYNSMDVKSASYRLREELEQYREFNLLQKSIEETQRQIKVAQQKLTAFNIIHADKTQALTVLIELKNNGVTMEEIYGLVKMCDMAKSIGPGLNQLMGMGFPNTGFPTGRNGEQNHQQV